MSTEPEDTSLDQICTNSNQTDTNSDQTDTNSDQPCLYCGNKPAFQVTFSTDKAVDHTELFLCAKCDQEEIDALKSDAPDY